MEERYEGEKYFVQLTSVIKTLFTRAITIRPVAGIYHNRALSMFKKFLKLKMAAL